MARSFGALMVVCSASLLIWCLPPACMGDPASDLAEAETKMTVAKNQAKAAESAVAGAEGDLTPIAARSESADQAVEAAESEVTLIEEELVNEREAAAQQVDRAEANYDDEKSSHDTTTTVGLVLAVVALLAGGVAFVLGRLGNLPLAKPWTQLLAGVLAIVFVGGLALALVPSSPKAPEFSAETLELSAAAEGDPSDPATPKLLRAEAAVQPLAEKAEPLDDARGRAEAQFESAKSTAEDAEQQVVVASRKVNVATREVEELEAEAAEEEDFRAEATTIDYGQLVKNPDAYRGERVVYTGQVLQIQEYGGGGFMLLSVTDEGYGFWTDNIWVDFEERTEVAEEDVITVYGKITGSEEYETQIGGSTYVPRMNAKYIDE